MSLARMMEQLPPMSPPLPGDARLTWRSHIINKLWFHSDWNLHHGFNLLAVLLMSFWASIAIALFVGTLCLAT